MARFLTQEHNPKHRIHPPSGQTNIFGLQHEVSPGKINQR